MSVSFVGSLLCLTLSAGGSRFQNGHAEDRSVLTRGVTSLIAPGASPGPINASGDAFVLITGKQGKALAPLFVATKVESGRAVAGGHEGFFSSRSMENPSNGRFLANIVTWLSRKPLTGLRIRLLDTPGLNKPLSDAGAVPSIVNVKNIRSTLSDLDVICMTQGALDNNSSDQIAVMKFVKAGHGLLIAGPGWGWLVTHPGKDLLADQTANRMLVPFGITFEDGEVGAEYSPNGADSPLLVSDGAIDGLLKGGLNTSDIATATSTVQRTLSHQGINSSPLATEIKNLASHEPGNGIPSVTNPLTTDKPFSRLKEVIDANRYKQLSPRETLPDPSFSNFPGPVEPNAPRINKTLTIDTSIPAWQSTGLYAAPGETVVVTVPDSATSAELGIRIGAHTDTLWDLEKWPRFPAISTYKSIRLEDTQVANPFGGLIFIEVPYRCTLGKIQISVSHAVMSPLFIRGKTSEKEWADMLAKSGAPWAELQGNLVGLVVPISSARKAKNGEALMAYWDEMMANCYKFYAAPHHPRPEKYCPDVEISAGYMHSGYPIMTHIDVADTMCSLLKLRGKSWTWGFYHEMGHNFQQGAWTWDGCGEVTNNLFSLYGSEKLNGVTPSTYGDAHPAMAPATAQKRLAKYLEGGAKYSDWTSNPFLALTFFAQLREQFGWEPFSKLFGGYWHLTPSEEPRSDIDKRDLFMVRFSRLVGKNLGPFFQAWGIPTTENARNSVSSLPSWMPKNWPK